jgi:AAA15 family ATPase/GTPase
MLSKFEVKNFKNFKGTFVLNLLETKSYEFNTECVKNGVANNILIYGPNGIGKSNLGLAIFDIISHLTDKERKIDLYRNYLNAESDSEIAEFKYEFKFDNRDVQYFYAKKNLEEIIYERLILDNKLVVDYDRRKEEIKDAMINLSGTETLIKDLSQIKISVIKYLKSSAVLAQDSYNILFYKFVVFVVNMLFFKSLDERLYFGYDSGAHNIIDFIIEKSYVENFQEFLHHAEIDCNIKSVEINDKKQILFDFGNRSIDFLTNSSTGTKALTLFYYWFQRMEGESNKPSLVFIDEFDAFYHNSLSELIVNMLKGRDYQTILTTHNTSLMDNNVLRPDCNFLMYKTKMGALSSFTNKELRRAHNIEKLYRAGAFYNG